MTEAKRTINTVLELLLSLFTLHRLNDVTLAYCSEQMQINI